MSLPIRSDRLDARALSGALARVARVTSEVALPLAWLVGWGTLGALLAR